jgi:hypothetical protein
LTTPGCTFGVGAVGGITELLKKKKAGEKRERQIKDKKNTRAQSERCRDTQAMIAGTQFEKRLVQLTKVTSLHWV